MKLVHIVGTRPNFPKLAPVYRAGRSAGIEQIIVHTGQHYDELMSESFFDELGIPAPDLNLAVGSGRHGAQTARIIDRLEPVLDDLRPDWTVVYGDVNSTLGAVVVASKLGLRTAHVEAGLRSDDRSMPEEINRLVTDRLADLLLTPSRDADQRLRSEGEPESKIVFVGNVMVDTLLHTITRLGLAPEADGMWQNDGSVLVTLHRPSNVDEPARLAATMEALREVATTRAVHFPAHPRTRARLVEFGIAVGKVGVTEPVPYETMLRMMTKAHCLITDSGGIQEETTALGIPCLTVRYNTERPITISEGTNSLVPEPGDLVAAVAGAVRRSAVRRPEGWDGNAGTRVIAALIAKTSR